MTTYSLTLNADDMVVYFNTEEEQKAHVIAEKRACGLEYKDLWIAVSKKARIAARSALYKARIKFAKDRGLQVHKVRD